MAEKTEDPRKDAEDYGVQSEDSFSDSAEANLNGGKEVDSQQVKPHARRGDLAPGEEVRDPRKGREELGVEALASEAGLEAAGKKELDRVRPPRLVEQEQVSEANGQEQDLGLQAPDGDPRPAQDARAQEQNVKGASVTERRAREGQ